ncbi:MAG: DinB family protein [Vicinamibacterales bacterium]
MTVTNTSDPLRAQLARVLDWEEAHVGFDKAIAGMPADRRGALAPGIAYSVWQLVEHMRLAQVDVLDFCLDPSYVHAMKWPDDYWPQAAPADAQAWDHSVAAFKADRERLKDLARNETIDLHALVPTGKGHQTYLRAILLMADHNAYHLGQIVAVRRALGIWE